MTTPATARTLKGKDNMIKVYIRNSDYGNGKSIWIVSRIGEKTMVAKPITFEMVEVNNNAISDPTIRLSGEFETEFLGAFAEALDNSGVKTDNDHKIKGLLEAKDAHLQDMRKLVFQSNKDFEKREVI